MTDERIIYETDTGKVALRLQGSDPEMLGKLAQLNMLESQAVLGTEVGAGATPSYVEDGMLVQLPLQPSPDHAFDYAAKQWVDPRTLDELRSASARRIDTAYEAAIQQSVAYMGTVFQADKASQEIVVTTLTVLTPLGSTPEGFFWKDAANNEVLMSLQQLQGLSQAIFAQGWAAFQHRAAKKAEIAVSATPDTVSW